jgi:hypothetical protein
MVISMLRVGSMNLGAFAREAKKARPGLPFVVLAYNLLDVERLRESPIPEIDRVFLWLGDVKILLAIIKSVEDLANIDHDIRAAGVQAILLIEDSVRFYSTYLPLIYTEIMKQTRLLIAEGVNLSHKMLRMRARPKILLASSFEGAQALFDAYRANLLGLITDVEFPRGGRAAAEAGLDFAAGIKAAAPDMPVLIQSHDEGIAPRVRSMGASFVNKGSAALLQDLRRFIQEYFGFGDFVFRRPDGSEIARVADLHALVAFLDKVPDDSLAYHANRNHFSKWLMARTEFEIAHLIRPRNIAEFGGPGEMRRYLVSTFHRFLHQAQTGVVVSFVPQFFDPEAPFVKIGSGSLGGKARGLSFFNTLMAKRDFSRHFSDVRIAIPPTAVVATDVFDSFMEQNSLYDAVHREASDAELREAFLRARLPERTARDLEAFASRVTRPLAVRSSSLMEDSQSQPFAGIYETYLLANNGDFAQRLDELCRAVKLVYASTFSADARSYLGTTAHLQDEEKMAVILQAVVGRRHGGRFYPDVSGVAQSYNFYPLEPLRPEDGTAYVALGLGKSVVDGYRVLRFSPAHPRHLHQFATLEDTFRTSQQEFIALDLSGASGLRPGDEMGNLLRLGLDAAEADGTLQNVGSTYSREDDALFDGVARPGPRLVTFAHVLKSGIFPLAEVLRFVMDVGREGMGCHVEMEFAADLAAREFHILQMRPMTSLDNARQVETEGFAASDLLCRSPRSLGHGNIEGVRDVVYVRPGAFQPALTRAIAAEVGRFNSELRSEGLSYVLLGPGRWGSADPWLGIPVMWGQISAARLIVETALPDFQVDPSYGTHFLHNVTSLGIGYLTIHPAAAEGFIDWAWLDAQKARAESEHVRHVRLDSPLDIRIDGRSGRGVVVKPGG